MRSGQGQVARSQSDLESQTATTVGLLESTLEIMKHRVVNVAMEIDTASVAVAMASTSGIKAGLSHLKLTSHIKPMAFSGEVHSAQYTPSLCKTLLVCRF